MPKKTCKHCGVVDFNHVCPVVTKEKNARDAKREDKSIYWCSRWRRLRADVLEYQNNICMWSLYVEGVIVQANVCHHIIEIMTDDSKAYDIENVIALDRDVHRDTVHRLYKTDKKKTQDILRECMKLWDSNVRIDGLGCLRDRVRGL